MLNSKLYSLQPTSSWHNQMSQGLNASENNLHGHKYPMVRGTINSHTQRLFQVGSYLVGVKCNSSIGSVQVLMGLQSS